eukprot:TRINITY_DN2159_c0_g1_i4.p1 TRINITY_DN2159_c0_g1~~TRINITY_DN2159_c0_g1_i4.p1  ORF type:complete len:233 (+),score=59.27 TRINITY_DN2159_c0_g1_i4:133-831(+)
MSFGDTKSRGRGDDTYTKLSSGLQSLASRIEAVKKKGGFVDEDYYSSLSKEISTLEDQVQKSLIDYRDSDDRMNYIKLDRFLKQQKTTMKDLINSRRNNPKNDKQNGRQPKAEEESKGLIASEDEPYMTQDEEIEFQEENATLREEKLLRINRQIKNAHTIYKDVAEMSKEQSADLASIYDFVDRVAIQVKGANQELMKAKDLIQDSKSAKCKILFVLLIVVFLALYIVVLA